jgi:hypothetical protein
MLYAQLLRDGGIFDRYPESRFLFRYTHANPIIAPPCAPDLTVRTVGPPLALSRSAVSHRTGPALLGGGLMAATEVLEPSSLSKCWGKDAFTPEDAVADDRAEQHERKDEQAPSPERERKTGKLFVPNQRTKILY